MKLIRNRKIQGLIVGIVVIAFIIALIKLSLWVQKGREKERLSKQRVDAITEIETLSSDQEWIATQIKNVETGGDWYTSNFILFDNGEWLTYFNRCSKEDREAQSSYDMFIAKGSNGKWYFSSWHFCVNLINLKVFGQPGSLAYLELACYLKEFDGASENCSQSTWPVKDEIRIDAAGDDAILIAKAKDNVWSEVTVCGYGKIFKLKDKDLDKLDGFPPEHKKIVITPDSVGFSFDRLMKENGVTVKKELTISVNSKQELSVKLQNKKK